jgi:hypothetical protein
MEVLGLKRKRPVRCLNEAFSIGSRGGIRTPGQVINSHLLYR